MGASDSSQPYLHFVERLGQFDCVLEGCYACVDLGNLVAAVAVAAAFLDKLFGRLSPQQQTQQVHWMGRAGIGARVHSPHEVESLLHHHVSPRMPRKNTKNKIKNKNKK